MNDSYSSMPSFTLPVCCFNYHMNLLLLPNAFSWDGNVNLLEQTCVNTALIKCSCMPFQSPLTVPLQNCCAWGLVAALAGCGPHPAIFPPSQTSYEMSHMGPQSLLDDSVHSVPFTWKALLPFRPSEPHLSFKTQITCWPHRAALPAPEPQQALIFHPMAPPTLCMFCQHLNTVDTWIMQVWTARVHLHMDFFQSTLWMYFLFVVIFLITYFP